MNNDLISTCRLSAPLGHEPQRPLNVRTEKIVKETLHTCCTQALNETLPNTSAYADLIFRIIAVRELPGASSAPSFVFARSSRHLPAAVDDAATSASRLAAAPQSTPRPLRGRGSLCQNFLDPHSTSGQVLRWRGFPYPVIYAVRGPPSDHWPMRAPPTVASSSSGPSR